MKKFLSLVLALVMTMSLVTVSAGAADFGDSDEISSEDYAEAIDVMSALEIIDGYNDGDFRPQGTLTRGAAAKIIACMMLGKTTAEALGTQAAPFKDVPVGSTFAGYIAYCAESGLIDGYADGTFRPSAQLTGFAFLKMLLTAMGYDSAVEGFTGPNWTVNVARRAIENGLTDGNDDFVGTQLATREQACLYAVNTIQATLVEYENKGSSITINGVEIVQGASNPTVVTSVNENQATSINSDAYTGNVSGSSSSRYYTVEFGERYMPKLSLKGTTDAFMRPSHIWSYDGEEIGTYTNDADLTYTAEVTANTIYDELGLTETVIADVYEDGLQIADFEVKDNETNDAHKIGGNGVLVQVYESGHWQLNSSGQSTGVWITDVTITLVNTYVGDVTAKIAATSVKPAYIQVVARENEDVTYPSGSFETEDFNVDDVVVYNYSYKGNPDAGVKNVAVAETATGTLTGFTTDKSATVGGTKYDYAEKFARQATTTTVNTDVTVVFDPYGYAIDIDGNTSESYAVVLAVSDDGDIRSEASLLFTDSSDEVVTTTRDYYGNFHEGDIASYTIKSGDKYSLDMKQANNSTTDAVDINNGEYSFTVGTTTYNANGNTIFLVKDTDGNGDPVYAAYEGIKNVPSITKTSDGNPVTVYCKTSGRLATVVYVDASAPSATVLDPSSDVIFIKGNNDGDGHEYGVGDFREYVSVVNGELREDADELLRTSTATNVTAGNYDLFDGVSYDQNNIATLNKTNNVIYGEGVYKMANDVLGTYTVLSIGAHDAPTPYTDPDNGASIGARVWYPVADDCQVILINEDGDISTGHGIGSVVRDTTDMIWFKLNASNEITYAFIETVAEGLVPEEDTYDLTVEAPANDYSVTVNGVTKTSNGSGNTAVFELANGTYTVTATKAGAPTLTASVTIDDENAYVDLTADLETLNVTIFGSGSAVPNSELVVKDSSGVEIYKEDLSANDTGATSVSLLPGTYTVSYKGEYYAINEKTVTIPADTSVDLTTGYNPVSFSGMDTSAQYSITLSKDGEPVLTYVSSAVATPTLYVPGAVGDYTYEIQQSVSGKTIVNATGTAAASTAVIYAGTTLTLTAKGSGGLITATLSGTTPSFTSSDSAVVTVEAYIQGMWVTVEELSLPDLTTATADTTKALDTGNTIVRGTAVITLASGYEYTVTFAQAPINIA